MSDIKMSDVFELPLLPERTIFGMNEKVTKHAVTAINAYDANQEEIKQLKANIEVQREWLKSIAEQVKHGFVICTACSHQDTTEHHDTLWMAESALKMTPQQCCAEIMADAIEEFTASLTYGFETGDGRGMPQDGFKYAQQLRDNAK